MIATVPHAASRTLSMADQLGAMWGPDIHANVSVHGLSHEQMHELGRRETVWRDPAYPSVVRYIASARVRTPMGREVVFMGDAAVSGCERCRELACAEEGSTEIVERAGLTGQGGAS